MNKKNVVIGCLIVSVVIAIVGVLYTADTRRFSEAQALKLRHRRIDPNSISPGDSLDRIFWFMQISDLHLSQFSDNGRTANLSKLCRNQVRVIVPEMVIVSGDITDAKFPSQMGSTQFIEEWAAYDAVLQQTGVLNVTRWLDMRGNHDNFNVPSTEHTDNYFRQFSPDGSNFTQSYMITHRKPFGTYSFIGMDACPSPGLKRPFNFFGLLTTNLANSLKAFSRKATGSNQTFWFGHYPTSTIVSPGFDLRGLISNTAFAYLCGHLHTLHRWVPKMYTVQPQGYLELELADWREERAYRIVAVDHDLVSFVDTSLKPNDDDNWPLVLITNPKDAAFLLPSKEPVQQIRRSTHIRVLAWSKYPIKEVFVIVDGRYLGEAMPAVVHQKSASFPNKLSPLYVLPWYPEQLSQIGTHVIEVTCKDVMGNTRHVKQSFTLDGSVRWNFGLLQGFILLRNQTADLIILFYLVWSVPFLCLVTARIAGYGRFYCYVLEDICLLRGLREVANCDVMFFSLFSYLLYILCGPIFMGYLLDYHFGFVFSFGVFVNNTFIPESMTYMAETIQQIVFTYPLLILLSYRMSGVCGRSIGNTQDRPCCCCRGVSRGFRERFCMGVLAVVQLTFCVFMVLMPYSRLAFLLSPGRLWYLGIGCALFRYAGRRQRSLKNNEYSPVREPGASPTGSSSTGSRS